MTRIDTGNNPACWSWTVEQQDLHDASVATTMKEAVAILMIWQHGLCAMCGTADFYLYPDHDHDTQLIRGLICQRCNNIERSDMPYDETPLVLRYRRINPAFILDMHVRYRSRRRSGRGFAIKPPWDATVNSGMVMSK